MDLLPQDSGLGLKMPETVEPPGMVPLAKAAWDGDISSCRARLNPGPGRREMPWISMGRMAENWE